MDGALAVPLCCCESGFPAGDPASAAALDAVKSVWPRMVEQEFGADVSVWMYMDDRAVRSRPDLPEDRADAVLDAVAARTQAMDASIGFVENEDKRQRWRAPASVEHLGVLVRFNRGGEPEDIAPRDGWPNDSCHRLRAMPGPVGLRHAVAIAMVAPRYLWAAPFVARPTRENVAVALAAVARTRASWWCKGRWAAGHVAAHPVCAWAVRTVTSAENYHRGARSADEETAAVAGDPLRMSLVKRRLQEALAVLQLESRRGEDGRLWLRPARGAHAGAAKNINNSIRRREGWRREEAFEIEGAAGLHLLRVAARGAALAAVNGRRHEACGSDNIDVNVSTGRAWRREVGRLSQQLRTIEVVRGGAAGSPTRRFLERRFKVGGELPTEDDEVAHGFIHCAEYVEMKRRCRCPLCGATWCSLGHITRECPLLGGMRAEFSPRPPRWWRELQPVTAKSLWATGGMTAEDLIAVAKVVLAADSWHSAAALGLRPLAQPADSS